MPVNKQIFLRRKGGNSTTQHYSYEAMRKERKAAKKLARADREDNRNSDLTIHPTKGFRRNSIDRIMRVFNGRKKMERLLNF